MEENRNNGGGTPYFDNLSGNPGTPPPAGSQAYGMPPLQPPRVPREERGSGKGLFLGGLITGVAAALLIVGICYLGMYLQETVTDRQNGATKVSFQEGSAINADVIAKMQALEDTINEYFYLHQVTEEELQVGIYKGMLKALGDPYSEYYTAEELTSLMQSTQGVYFGIGAYMQQDKATTLPRITGTIAGSPSEEVDIREDDLIYEVDGVPTQGLSLTEVTSMIKGPENTEVELTLIREGATDYIKVTVVRRKVESPTVTYEMKEDGMAYIQVSEFDDVTVKQFENALASARAEGMKGMILDLRGNPGGSLNAVVEMLRMMLPEGMIVYTQNKEGKRSEFLCDGEKELEVPLVVLVDRNSASASEIMAGAIKDHGIGTLVGTTTFGKGIVQQIMPLRDGSALKITISAYYTPNGNNIHGIGIEPDVVCEFDGEAYYGSEDRPDNQLEKAKEVLKGMIMTK